MNPLSDSEIHTYRTLFPVTKNWIYLNHAGVAPISTRVWDAIEQAGGEALAEGFTAGTKWSRHIEHVRNQAADFIAADPKEIAFVKNTSHGISLVARGLGLRSGDEVIISEGEFPTNVYPWMALEKGGVSLKKIPERGGELQLDALESLVTPQTKVIALSSVQYGSGYRLPLEEIGSFCRKRGIYFVLDAIQSLGAFELDVAKSQVDCLTADAHKWLLGQEGIGIFYLRGALIEKIEPALLGWSSVAHNLNFDKIDFTLAPSARRFEEGTQNTLGIYGLGGAFGLLAEVGIERVSQRILHLGDILIAGLKSMGVEIVSSLNPRFRSGIVSFRVPGGDDQGLQDLERHLYSKKIYVSVRRRSLRVSPHFYNTEEEIQSLLRELKIFLGR